ncbi:ATP-binding protein [Oceanispirochaeta sp.]|jgi:ATP-dependent DNA helicase RecG|uniref:ATP-binding protein n=1 Tax=Oceanispirochaeta sp. TaxID=2035350 RepID=UPI0026043D75|nr:ATP-binding protein [Oceanispirochaeta sp.]MDA3956976.1 HTH domain-containing protein [Oceanispirochaeta sp.]
MSASPGRLIIYKDKVILDNPCTQHFFGEITPENLHPYSHNPTLCKFMIQLGRFDELGSGVRNINKYLPLYSKGAKPVFKEDRQYFQLVLPLAGPVSSNSPKSSKKSSQKSSQKIVLLMSENPDITIAQLSKKIGISDRSIKKHIAFLQSQNRVKRIGPDKGGHWEVLE